VELDPERQRGGPEDVRAASAAIVPPGDAAPQKLTLSWTGDDTLEARFPIQKDGIYLGAVEIGKDKILPLAPLSLPYSPEFEPRLDPDEGKKTLAEIARVSGGIERTVWDDVFNASRLRDRQVRDLVLPLALALLLLHIGEIGGRRLLLFAAANARLQNLKVPHRAKFKLPARAPKPVAPQPQSHPEPAKPKPTAAPEPVASPLARAKARSKDRTN
jgi:hypothetical protein